MIDKTFDWARANGKIITHPINGGEYVNVNVYTGCIGTEEEGSRMTSTAAGTIEACLLFAFKQSSWLMSWSGQGWIW